MANTYSYKVQQRHVKLSSTVVQLILEAPEGSLQTRLLPQGLRRAGDAGAWL